MILAFAIGRFVSLMLTFYFVSAQDNLFGEHDTIFDLTCSGTNVLLTEFQSSKIKCTVLCENNNLCSGFTFRTTDRNCVGCKGGDGNLVSNDDGMKYYTPKYRKWGLQCTFNDECVGENTDCFDGMCVFTPGYSFQATTWSCLAGCITYGDTFQKYSGFALGGNNYRKLRDIALDSCLQECQYISGCVSVDYNPMYFDDLRRCNIQRVTALDEPHRLESREGSEYHNRNCR